MGNDRCTDMHIRPKATNVVMMLMGVNEKTNGFLGNKFGHGIDYGETTFFV